ncbi:tRNA (adenosine(37)-N6)-threonylcarbamoyltransferase complex dimerization subunit type 1 TsaB [Microbacterium amylolyticum]|uniref:tRNA threonylcarbamoyl adenosine modification protein YeaZ n=1 Tax=Microbacterium amylolyticum TaxID=936337 RepID=A0ABS4ZLS0_9MICO|nr:tRNA (adenosine(37)-N6)-threonylcarbamoyltransferase complex dimerization subunit type 1 TsaB [Microbacterium amylolyticum]MBP2437401.1 tRNA threonylcarbamoyl adenosine modification protein YeaZ [Microbacterium amylolyticum]
MILAIDSSLGTSVAVVDSATGVVAAQADSEGTRGHAEVVGTLIAQALAEAGVTARDVTAVAAGMGPGPFTGLRIGIAAARAFAVGRGLSVVPVVSHDGPALDAMEGGSDDVTVVTDARRREHAVTVYGGRDGDGLPIRVTEPHLVPSAQTPASASGAGITTRISAGAIGRIAARMISAGRVDAAMEPLYLRAPDVTAPGAAKRVST